MNTEILEKIFLSENWEVPELFKNMSISELNDMALYNYIDMMIKFPGMDRKEYSDMICHIKTQMYDFEQHLDNLRIMYRKSE
jgi:hypothetical protein